MKKRYVWVILLLLIIGLIGIFTGGEEETTEDKIKNIVHNIIGKEVENEDSIVSLSLTSGNVRIVMKKIPLSQNTYKKQLLNDSKQILEKLSGLEGISYVNLEWQGKLIDQSGNSEWKPVMRINVEKGTLDNINWEDLNENDIENVVDDYWQNEIFN